MTTSPDPSSRPESRFGALRIPQHTPLHNILRNNPDIDNLTPHQLQRLQGYVVTRTPPTSVWGMDRFVADVIANKEVVVAYFRPTPLAVGKGQPPELLWQLPFNYAMRAANRARHMEVLTQPHNRVVAWCCAFLAPCGIFHAVDPRRTGFTNTAVPTHLAIQQVRDELLGDAVRKLRQGSPPLGDTVAAIFDLPHGDDINEAQVAALKAAVSLSQVEINDLWGAVPRALN